MKKTILTLALVLALCLVTLAGCMQPASSGTPLDLASGGTLVLKVNPEIAVEYDKNGTVTGVIARNQDAIDIIGACKDLIGKPADDVVLTLVEAIGDAGYFVEEVEGKTRQITLEIEAGSFLPSQDFLDGMVTQIRDAVSAHDWTAPLTVNGQRDYGVSDYLASLNTPAQQSPVLPQNPIATERPLPQNPIATEKPLPQYPVGEYKDTDYGPYGDGVTDFGRTDYDDTDYGPNADGVTDFGRTDYDDTDYGPNADGVTDFGRTDYDDTDYGPNADGVTDYRDTPYDKQSPYDKETPYGNSPYDKDSPYDKNTPYGDSDYRD